MSQDPGADPDAHGNRRVQALDRASDLVPPLRLVRMAFIAAKDGLKPNVPESVAQSTEGLYFGMNESSPITAPPSTRRAGLILYRSRISRTPTAIAAVSAPKIAPFAMVKQPASRSPIETGASPC
jgi:hypothetical protein